MFLYYDDYYSLLLRKILVNKIFIPKIFFVQLKLKKLYIFEEDAKIKIEKEVNKLKSFKISTIQNWPIYYTYIIYIYIYNYRFLQ